MPFRRHRASMNLSTTLYDTGDNSSNLSSTCDVPRTVLDFSKDDLISSLHLL